MQGFGLLGAEVDSLKMMDFDFRRGLLLKAAEDQKEVPYADPYLDGIGVSLAVFRSIDETEVSFLFARHRGS